MIIIVIIIIVIIIIIIVIIIIIIIIIMFVIIIIIIISSSRTSSSSSSSRVASTAWPPTWPHILSTASYLIRVPCISRTNQNVPGSQFIVICNTFGPVITSSSPNSWLFITLLDQSYDKSSQSP